LDCGSQRFGAKRLELRERGHAGALSKRFANSTSDVVPAVRVAVPRASCSHAKGRADSRQAHRDDLSLSSAEIPASSALFQRTSSRCTVASMIAPRLGRPNSSATWSQRIHSAGDHRAPEVETVMESHAVYHRTRPLPPEKDEVGGKVEMSIDGRQQVRKASTSCCRAPRSATAGDRRLLPE